MARVFQRLSIRRMTHKNKTKPRKKLYTGTYVRRIKTPSYSYFAKAKVPYSTATPVKRKKKVLVRKRR